MDFLDDSLTPLFQCLAHSGLCGILAKHDERIGDQRCILLCDPTDYNKHFLQKLSAYSHCSKVAAKTHIFTMTGLRYLPTRQVLSDKTKTTEQRFRCFVKIPTVFRISIQIFLSQNSKKPVATCGQNITKQSTCSHFLRFLCH